MNDKKHTGNPIFDLWLTNQEQLFKAQAQWLSPGADAAEPDADTDAGAGEAAQADPGLLEQSLQSWRHCEAQYRHWMQAAEHWLDSQAAPGAHDVHTGAEALTSLLNPATFLHGGFRMMEQVSSKLVNGPDFADLWTLEKKVLKSGLEWQAFQEAGQNYLEVIVQGWLRAFQRFSDEFLARLPEGPGDPEDCLARWLQIADAELVATLRSEEFLTAQRQLFKKGAAYRLKHQEFAEMWCESHTLPTRTEVDDLHRTVYQLRRELRQLKQQVARLQSRDQEAKPAPQPAAATAATNKQGRATARKKKAPAKSAARAGTNATASKKT